MKSLILFVSLSLLSQPAICGQWVSTWQRVSRSIWTAPVVLLGTSMSVGATEALVDVKVAIGVAALGVAYFFYTLHVTENRRLRINDIGRQILYQEGDNLRQVTIDKILGDGHDFNTTAGIILSSKDIVAYEIFDHDDLGRKILFPANNDSGDGHIKGHVEKVFTSGFYKVVTQKVGTSDPITLFVYSKDGNLRFVKQ